jgi:hypothetical protein
VRAALATARELVIERNGPGCPGLALMELDELRERVGDALVDAVLAVDPSEHGIDAPFLGLEPVPDGLVASHRPDWATQWVSATVRERFESLAAACLPATGRVLRIDSGYRSPAHQVLTFAWYLDIRRALPPGWSEHCREDHALDLTVGDREYAWLRANAAAHGFVESYPTGNAFGVAAEPWHWRLAAA